jgi:predicted nucleic acid-binding protein
MGVVDASVVVAAMSATETHHPEALAWWLGEVQAGRGLHAPAIVVPEATAGAGAVVDDPNSAPDTIARWLAASGVTLWPVSPRLATRAAQLVGAYGLRGCDAVYVALAEQLGEPLVTLDRRQLERGGDAVPTTAPIVPDA